MSFNKQIKQMNKELAEISDKRKSLKTLKMFVLDNSLRESTVGQLRGHTIENKWNIYNEVKFVRQDWAINISF